MIEWLRDQHLEPVIEIAGRTLPIELRRHPKAKRLTLRLAPDGSAAHRRVFDAMRAIPHGETRTYGEIARATGLRPDEVGQGCAANPIPVIIPCHRVMGARGLTGFSGAGGVETKVALLRHEGAAGLLI